MTLSPTLTLPTVVKPDVVATMRDLPDALDGAALSVASLTSTVMTSLPLVICISIGVLRCVKAELCGSAIAKIAPNRGGGYHEFVIMDHEVVSYDSWLCYVSWSQSDYAPHVSRSARHARQEVSLLDVTMR
jgi:hypothetical protein